MFRKSKLVLEHMGGGNGGALARPHIFERFRYKIDFLLQEANEKVDSASPRIKNLCEFPRIPKNVPPPLVRGITMPNMSDEEN